MQVVCEATQSTSSAVQVGAFECLVKIMHLYYDWMKMYMERALFGVRLHLLLSPRTLTDILQLPLIAHSIRNETRRR